MLALQVLFNDLITCLKEQVAPAPPSSCQSTLAQLSLPMFPLAHSELLTVSGCLLTAMERGLMEFARAERKTGSSCRMRTQRLLVWPTIASMQDMRRQLTNRCRCSKTNYLSARTANASPRSALPLLGLLLQHIQRIPAPLHARNVHVVAKVSGQCGGRGQGAGVACTHKRSWPEGLVLSQEPTRTDHSDVDRGSSSGSCFVCANIWAFSAHVCVCVCECEYFTHSLLLLMMLLLLLLPVEPSSCTCEWF